MHNTYFFLQDTLIQALSNLPYCAAIIVLIDTYMMFYFNVQYTHKFIKTLESDNDCYIVYGLWWATHSLVSNITNGTNNP